MIRQFQAEDFPELLILAEQMREESPYFRKLGIVNEKLIALGETIILRPDTMLGLVSKDSYGVHGFIMACISEFWFSYQKIASDLGLFITPGKRGGKAAVELIKGYEDWANLRNATEISLGVTTGVYETQTLKLYTKLGFKKVGYICKKVKGD